MAFSKDQFIADIQKILTEKGLTDEQRKFYEGQLLKPESQLRQEKKELLKKFRR